MYFYGTTARSGPGPRHCPVFTITLRHTIHGRTLPARRRDLYLAKHNTNKRETFLPPVEFEPTIPASEWSQTDALDRTAIDALCCKYCNVLWVWRVGCRGDLERSDLGRRNILFMPDC